MYAVQLQRLSQRGRAGSALAWLLILLVIGFVAYGAYLFFQGPAVAVDPDVTEGLPVWKEWRARQARQEAGEKPSAEQPAIAEVLEYETGVELGTEPRGKIALAIYPDGRVRGGWHGYYYKERKINFEIMSGDFEGSIYPKKIHRDEGGAEDASKLYFMAGGQFLLSETDFDKGTVQHRAGALYVTGWLSPDYSVQGNVTITSDERYFETFEWKSILVGIR
jgi:hypothetical protein